MLGCSVLLALMSILFRSRSLIIQALILLLYVLFRSRIRWRNQWIGVFTYLVGIVVFLLVFWDVIFYMFSPLLLRMFDDTRTSQLQQFFAQVSLRELLTGGGMDAEYKFSAMSSNYKYLDNQFLLEMFRFGIVPILTYTLVLLSPLVRAVVKLDIDLMRRCTIIVMWLLAMGGISVFFNLNVNIPCVVVFVLCGRLNKMCSLPIKQRG